MVDGTSVRLFSRIENLSAVPADRETTKGDRFLIHRYLLIGLVVQGARINSFLLRVQAIWKAIDDYAELETGNREYFWNRPHSIG
jgi:hypothetical protein